MDTAILVAIGVVASAVLTLSVLGIAVLFATSPRARAIFMEIVRNLQ